jgi:hypothetical protein
MTTRRKPAAQADEPEQESVREIVRNDYQKMQPQGCMMPIMFATMMAMMAFMVWDRTQSPPVAPVPVVVPTPIVDLSAFTAPITAKLATDKAKAIQIEAAYIGFRDALAGASGARVTDSRVFESVSRAFLTDLDAKGGVSVGAEIDNAIGSYLGMTKSTDAKEPGWEPIQFDAAKRSRLIEIVGAIATAAGSVK